MDIQRFALGGFKNYKDDELLVRGNTVLAAMENNAFFPDPLPNLEDVKALVDDFSAKLSVCRRKGSPQDTAVKNDSRKVLCNALTRLAFHVTHKADGVLAVLLSSGFLISNHPRAGNIPDIVRGIFLRDGRQSGQMRLDFTKQQNVLLYEYRYGYEVDVDNQVIWSENLSTSSTLSNVIAPVVPLQRYQVQVRAVNAHGKSEWSEAVAHVVR